MKQNQTPRQELAQYLNDALFIQNGKKDYDLVDDIMKIFEKYYKEERHKEELKDLKDFVGLFK